MNPDLAFSLANALVLPHWLLLITAPRWSLTKWLCRTLFIPMLLATLYLYFLFRESPSFDFSAFSTLEGVMTLLGSGQKTVALAGWIHYLAFDLVAGCWLLRDGQERGVRHGLLVPCLIGCFLLGPSGLLLYGLVRLSAAQIGGMRKV